MHCCGFSIDAALDASLVNGAWFSVSDAVTVTATWAPTVSMHWPIFCIKVYNVLTWHSISQIFAYERCYDFIATVTVWYFQCAKNCEMAYSMLFLEESLQCKSYHAGSHSGEWDFVVYIDCVCNSINYGAYLLKPFCYLESVTRLFLFSWLAIKKRCLCHCLHANGLKNLIFGNTSYAPLKRHLRSQIVLFPRFQLKSETSQTFNWLTVGRKIFELQAFFPEFLPELKWPSYKPSQLFFQ